MQLPNIQGVIRRRLLVNFRVDPSVIQRQLPAPFRPKLQAGYSVAGICLIRLENIRPKYVPSPFGINSENAAHRIAVTWEDERGVHDAVYIPRRDTSSLVNQLAGGRLFPGEHNRARFEVTESDCHIRLLMESLDHVVKVTLSATSSVDLPRGSCFRSLGEASKFFETGSLGYSATSNGERLDGIQLRAQQWKVEPLAVEEVYSSYFADNSIFPEGTSSFDCALIMRNIQHEWHAAMTCTSSRPAKTGTLRSRDAKAVACCVPLLIGLAQPKKTRTSSRGWWTYCRYPVQVNFLASDVLSIYGLAVYRTSSLLATSTRLTSRPFVFAALSGNRIPIGLASVCTSVHRQEFGKVRADETLLKAVCSRKAATLV